MINNDYYCFDHYIDSNGIDIIHYHSIFIHHCIVPFIGIVSYNIDCFGFYIAIIDCYYHSFYYHNSISIAQYFDLFDSIAIFLFNGYLLFYAISILTITMMIIILLFILVLLFIMVLFITLI